MSGNDRIAAALARLNTVLPLAQRQGECSAQGRDLHQRILRSFVSKGRILSAEEMAQYVDDLDEAVGQLRARELVTFSASGVAVGAYPFTSEDREHKVWINGRWVNAMCALDALAISPMFGERVRISSRCRISGDPVEIRQSGMIIENPQAAADVRLGIDWGAWDTNACCADSLCLEMMYLRDGGIARQWLAADDENREVFALPEAVELASRFFVPLVS